MNRAATKTYIDTPLSSIQKERGALIGPWFGCALPDYFLDAYAQGDSPMWLREYRAARETVALLDKNYRCYIKFTGPDRVRYLNAIFTNNIKDLAPNHGGPSLLLNPQGRILAEIEAYASEAALFCISYAMIRETLVPTLEKYIIMDEVTLTDETDKWGTVALEGPRAAQVTEQLTGVDVTKMDDLSFQPAAVNGMFCGVTRRSPGGVPSAEFLASRNDLPLVWNFLRDAVAKADGTAAGYQALNALRLEQGVPWFGYDFGDKQIPHEAGLADSHISYTKGCYTGQEIVERVRSRGQVNRVRVLLKLAGGDPPSPDTPLFADSKEVGYITRSTFSPALRTPIAMAYVRREHSSPATQLLCDSHTATVITPPVVANG